jgi:hypothetical protein
MTDTGYTPLMLAAHCGNTPMVDIFLSILPRQQFLDELTLLACKYTINGVVNKRNQAYCYFEKALSATIPICNIKPCEAYEFRSECQTLDELALIREDDNAMLMHALLVNERVLLKSSNVNHLASLITAQSNVYRWGGSFHRCLQLRLHAYGLLIQTQYEDRNYPASHKKKLYALVNILFEIFHKEGVVPVESLTLTWSWIVNRADVTLSTLLFKLLFIITYVSVSLINDYFDS